MELKAKIDPNTKLSTLSDDIEKEGEVVFTFTIFRLSTLNIPFSNK